MVEEPEMSVTERVESGAVAAAPSFPIPPHLIHIDELTLYHMQCTLGDELVQRYLESRRVANGFAQS